MAASQILFTNTGYTTLAGAINSIATSANLAPGSGAQLPSPGSGQLFKMTFVDAATGTIKEIVNVTNVTGDVITIVRGQEGTSAENWNAGDLALPLITAGCLQAMLQSITYAAARIVTASGSFVTTSADTAVGLYRSSSLAASSTTLPADASVGQVISFEDLYGNMNAYPLTVNAPASMTICNETSILLNVNRQSAAFRFYGSNLWSVKL
jgi:hypothetical protein